MTPEMEEHLRREVKKALRKSIGAARATLGAGARRDKSEAIRARVRERVGEEVRSIMTTGSRASALG